MNNLTDKEFDLIRGYIKTRYGINLNDEKKSLVYARLRTVLQKNNIDSFGEYYNYLIEDKTGEAAVTFIDKITTNHTFFMREVNHFNYFNDQVLPYLEKIKKNKDIRLWCAGCSTGEEPYTLQFVLQEYFGAKAEQWDTTILATDISTAVLSKAYEGVYSLDQMKTLPKEWIQKYFVKQDQDQYQIIEPIRKKVIFRKLNLMDQSFPFRNKMDVIFCRNVMIYFDADTRDQLVKKFYDCTADGGYLFIGHSETLNYSSSNYKYIIPAVYRKVT